MMSLQALQERLRALGVVGAGGAGYPTWAKMDDACDAVILNCAESEPLLTPHQQLLERHARTLLTALTILAKTLGASAHVAIGHAHHQALAAVEACLPGFPDTAVHTLPDIYPAGDELMVIHACLGRVVPPGCKPDAVGAVVLNVETLYNVYRALQHGAPVIDKLVTISGAVARPVTLRVPLGTRFDRLIDAAGGAASDTTLLHNGPLTGRLAGAHDVVLKTTNAVLALPDTHPVILRQRTRLTTQLLRARAACCQCGMCTALCPRHLLGYPLKPDGFIRAAAHGITQDTGAWVQALYCSQCGLCEAFACQQGLSPRALIASAGGKLYAAGVSAPTLPAPEPLAERAMRGASLHRLMARMDLLRYAHPAPYDPAGLAADRLWLPLRMHAGAPAIALVQPGQMVVQGTCIAEANGLGAAIHAPIDGIITLVTSDGIEIDGTEPQGGGMHG